MADALKDMFNKEFYKRLAMEFSKADKNFNADKFVKEVVLNMEELSLNQRMRNTSIVLKKHLPADYKKSIDLFIQVAPKFKSHYTALLFPDFVGQYGIEHFDFSLEALKHLTQFGSSEFAIREYLKRDFTKTLKVMNKWAEDKNHHVRRLASEGSRARLPWSFNLDEVLKNPSVTNSILEKLKADDELYVKKSVANHLNDFSKHHSDYLISVLKGWDNTNANTSWIIKHASRTLIKKGNRESLALFNFEKNVKVKVDNLKLSKSKIKLGDTLSFSFDIISEKATTQKLVIDYAVHYTKQSGDAVPKVFKLKEVSLKPKESLSITKTHRFMDFTTRKHYSGKHLIEIIVNGDVKSKKSFDLFV